MKIGDVCTMARLPCVPKKLQGKQAKVTGTHANGFVFVDIEGSNAFMTVPYALLVACPYCRGDRHAHNATCTRSECQEAAYYACMVRASRTGSKNHRKFSEKLEAASLRASHHPGWGLRGQVSV